LKSNEDFIILFRLLIGVRLFMKTYQSRIEIIEKLTLSKKVNTGFRFY